MKAAVCDKYGPPDVLRIDDVPRPIPRDDEVLVRVRAATVNRTDCAFRQGRPFYVRLGYSYFTTGSPFKAIAHPSCRILGTEFSGVVEAIGVNVTEFAAGDAVFGVNVGRFGTHAEFVCVAERGPIAAMPGGTSFEDAAAVCDGVILAMMCLRRGDLRPGRSILVYGASGSIGTAGVQLAAKHFGADVTAVCNTRNVDVVRSLGADRVIDYTREDFTRGGEKYDVIFDAVGKSSFRRCRGALTPTGTYLATDGFANMALMLWTARSGAQKVVFPIPPRYTKSDVVFLKDLMAAGQYLAVVDRVYPLADVVAATKYVETEQKTGNVVLSVSTDPAR
jgi:NADPH:quinone reductase-like Zn-dependent oxidoreductase